MDEGNAGRLYGDPWTHLVTGILDARTDEATRRFGTELAAAVADGEVTPEVGQRLAAWQLASVREVTEHVRTVLPATLQALETARNGAVAYAEEWLANPEAVAPEPVGDEPEALSPFPDGSAVSSAETADGPARASRQPSPPLRRPTDARSDARRASPLSSGQPRTLEERRPRLLVADLKDTRKDRTN